MGLGSRSGGGGNYLTVYGGSIVKEWRKSKPKSEDLPPGKELKEREITMGKNRGNTVWYIEFDFLTGPVSKLNLDTSGDWGDNIEITINDVGDQYILQLKADSSFGRDFLRKLNNIDFTGDVCFEPWQMDAQSWFDLTGRKLNGSYKSGLSIKNGDENGEKVESYYTKENPNGLPELEQKKDRKGNITWDGTEQMDFLLDEFEKFVEKFNSGSSTSSNEPKDELEPEDNVKEPKGKRKKVDLPFG